MHRMLQCAKYSATCGHTLVAGDMLVSCQVHGIVAVNQGGTAGKMFYSSLTDCIFLSRAFFCLEYSFDGTGSRSIFYRRELL